MKFDIVYHGQYISVLPHVAEDENDDAGYSLAEACDMAAAWHEKEARRWRDGTHHTPRYYLKAALNNVD